MKGNGLVSLLLSLAASEAFAHQIWIEQDAKSAKVFFGEYGDNLKEASPGLLNKMPAPKVTLTSGKESKELKVSKGKDSYNVEGAIQKSDAVSVQVLDYPIRETKEDDKTIRTKWYPAARQVNEFASVAPSSTLDIVPNGKVNTFKLTFKEKGLGKTKLSLISPNGWMKEVYTDENGEFTVEPLWKGRYVILASHKDKTPGEVNGEKFDVLSYTSTATFEHKDGPATTRPEPAKPHPES